MRKYGEAQPIEPVQDEAEPEADAQGISVNAARDHHFESDAETLIHEGEDRD